MKRGYDNSKRQRQAELTRQRILDALIDQLGRGLEDFSIAEVAEAADVSLQTVYHYFPNRDAQIEAVTALLEERLTRNEPGPQTVADLPAVAERIIRQAAAQLPEVRAQTVSGIAREVRARRRRQRERAIEKAIAASCPKDAARLVAAAVSVLISAEFAIGLADRFGLAGEDLICTFTWMARVVAEAIARGDLPVPDEAKP